ncbi:unnamed protein product [Owenia fusiformis]|uniref:BRICHOS domain-containing protein n=1 Tax=Owenia fusiformis TaxID=6347 RepID=A0A8S4MWU2_OWEFU|nr:unnamed protein product [Owenia fusiformis]
MDSEKKALPSIYNISPEPIVIQETKKPDGKSNKKYIIGAVVAVMILLITVGAVLGALKLSNQFARDTIKEYRLASNAVVKLDKDNEMTEIDDPEEGYSAYNDFTKGLTMMKVVDGDSYKCYLNPLSRDALTPEAMDSYLEHHPGGENFTSHDRDGDLPKYMPAKEPISGRRFLGQYLREACEEFPIYWLIPAPEQTEERQNDGDDDAFRSTRGVVTRDKRHIIIINMCCYICNICVWNPPPPPPPPPSCLLCHFLR